MMKAVFINHSDTLGGASTVTFRLVKALRSQGVDARMLVAGRTTDLPYIAQAAPRWRSRIPFLAEHLRIFAGNGFDRADLFKVSIATDGLPLYRHPWVREADVVVLNWINQGMLSLRGIERIASGKPTVWTMHDMWNLTGVCHHSGTCNRFMAGCGYCPLLHRAAGKRDLSAVTFERKMSLYDSVPIRFVAVSNWLVGRAAESPLFGSRPISVIPNTFEPVEPLDVSRRELDIPDDGRPLVAICAARLDDPVKGLPIAVEALNMVADLNPAVVLIGEIRNPAVLSTLNVPFVHLGMVGERSRLQALFENSDVVLSSSLYESFGATLLEAQYAGTTPVAFTHDGRKDIITDGTTGYAADFVAGDIVASAKSLARSLRRAITKPLPAASLREAALRFSPDTVAAAYRGLFAEMI